MTGASEAEAAEEPTFTREQLADPAFYRAHRAEIIRAAAGGRVTGTSRGRARL